MSRPTPFADHFSSAAGGYARHRPTYPAALAGFLAEIAPATDEAWDAGCGSGQLTARLAERFAHVTATDASAAQVAELEPRANVTARVAPAERSGLAEGSVSLATAAQAAHWFDLARYYEEARRVVRPGGIVALITYGIPVVDDEAVQACLMRFYREDLGAHWPPERRHVERGYADLPFPFDERSHPPFAIERRWPLAALRGYVATWSAVGRLEAAGGGARFGAFAGALADVWGDPEAPRRVRWPIAMRVGRVR